jgi:large subunit ribosomal protein L13
MKTYSAKPKEIERKWFLIDAEGVVLGRLAVEIANILRGKNKPTFTPHIDTGDHVIVINADKIKITGNKAADDKYYWHTGFPGGIKETTREKILQGRFPERVLKLAVKRMISRNVLGAQVQTKLKVYAGAEHPHAAQNPEVYNFAAKNPKNKRVVAND